nr:hypothetical protein [Tanacetum cinerariifolium]
MHIIGKTVTELHAILKLHEETLPPKEVSPALHAIRAGRIQKNQKINRIRLLMGIKGKAKQRWEMHLCLRHLLLLNPRILQHPRRIFMRRTRSATNVDHGIIGHGTPPYMPQMNGVSERRNRTLLDMVRSMMSQTTLLKSFWDYVFESAARILNMVLNKKVDKTPYEKTDMDGAVHTYKARLVAKGFTQTLGINYEETFCPVANIRAIRILIAIAASYDYEIWQIDVKTAFLNGYLNEGKSQGASTPAEIQRMQNIPYASAVGSIMYAVRCTRPDVAFAQNITSQFQQNPSEVHWTAIKNILKYVRNTKDMFLVYGYETRAQGAVKWKSTKKNIFATSSTYAKYIAAFDASKEAVWIHKFIYWLGVVPTIEELINMYCDNTRAIAIAKDHGVTKGARHFRAKVHYLQETIKMGDVKIKKVDTDDN